jgi:hypothetical protein
VIVVVLGWDGQWRVYKRMPVIMREAGIEYAVGPVRRGLRAVLRLQYELGMLDEWKSKKF